MRLIPTEGKSKVFAAKTEGAIPSKYEVENAHSKDVFATIYFQDGAVGSEGINGAREEDVLAILIDRLRSFQGTKYACRETSLALTKLDEAMHWLHHRDNERKQRGVKGTSKS